MRSTTWIEILRTIPRRKHDDLMIVTSIGQEIAIQALLRMEEEYLMIRGRLAGTSDAGRVFFVPYDQINYLGFQHEIKEKEMEEIFGPLEGEAAAANGTGEGAEHDNELIDVDADGDLELAADGDEAVKGLPPGAGGSAQRVTNPSELLERIRSRSTQGSVRRPPVPRPNGG